MRGKVVGILKLIRVGNCLGAAVAAGLGAFLADINGKVDKTFLAMGVVAGVTAFGNAINDLYDVETDRVNMPQRPLVKGSVTPRQAMAVTVASAAGGLALSLPINPPAVALAATAIVLLWLYSAKLKGMFLVGNLIVGALGGLSLVYGAIAVDNALAVLGTALLFSLVMIAREILKTVEDYEGDLKAQLHTIAVVIGPDRALAVFTALALVCILLMPAYTVLLNAPWPILLASLSVSLLLAFVVLLARRPSPKNLRRAVTLTKVTFYLGMLVILVNHAVS
jgi:geranylgeranylglycerol-phosphate geranylgeranyltransferase